MSTTVIQRVAGFLFFIDVLLMTVLALQPMHIEGDINHVDKFLHFIAYFVLAGLAFLYARHFKSFLNWCFALLVYGGVIEYLQSFMPGRYMSFADFIANAGGIAVMILLARMYQAKKSRLAQAA
ncbi:MAG: VanZ family protein [Pseudomonadales bacterium]